MITLHIVKQLKSRKQLERNILGIFKKTVKKAKKCIPAKNITVEVCEVTSLPLKQMGGIGGYCPRKNYIKISIDLRYCGSKENFKKNFKLTLLHEFHHAARQQQGFPLDGISLFEQMINEGLADYFVYEMTKEIPVWSRTKINFSKSLQQLKPLLQKNISMKLYSQIFLEGSKKLQIVRWTGYTIGFRLIQNYLLTHEGVDSKSLLTMPYSEFKIH